MNALRVAKSFSAASPIRIWGGVSLLEIWFKTIFTSNEQMQEKCKKMSENTLHLHKSIGFYVQELHLGVLGLQE
jgi:hypothetical protein